MPVMGPLPGRENECVRAGATTDCAIACTAGRAPVAKAGRAAPQSRLQTRQELQLPGVLHMGI